MLVFERGTTPERETSDRRGVYRNQDRGERDRADMEHPRPAGAGTGVRMGKGVHTVAGSIAWSSMVES